MKKLLCSKCGSSISIGMMFCPICGTRPDSITMEKNARAKPHNNWFLKIIRGVVIVVLLIVALGLGLVAWPNEHVIGVRGDAGTVYGFIRAVKEVEAGYELEATFTDGDINAYLKSRNGLKLDRVLCSVEFTSDTVHLLVRKKVGSFTFFKYKFSPIISMDTWYKVEDKSLVISRASIGHLPLFGSIKSLAGSKTKGLFIGNSIKKDWIDNIAFTEVKKNQAVITFKNTFSSNIEKLGDKVEKRVQEPEGSSHN